MYVSSVVTLSGPSPFISLFSMGVSFLFFESTVSKKKKGRREPPTASNGRQSHLQSVAATSLYLQGLL